MEYWKVRRLEGSSNEGILSFPQVIISDRAERRRREASYDDGDGDDDDVVRYVWVIWMYGQLFWQPLQVTGDRKHTKL